MDWFRKKAWSKEDESDFFQRLGRARRSGRAQYLKIQSIELLQTGKSAFLSVAESLLHKVLEEYPEDLFEKSSVLHTLGDIEKQRENWSKALDFYKQALSVEQEFPQVKTQAYLDFSELVVKTKHTSSYVYAKELILERAGGFLFPVENYKAYSILSIISHFEGDKDRAVQYAKLAEESATAETSGLSYHKHLGIVHKRDNWLDSLVNAHRS